ncbi:MAG: toll/interleukin-1 receptor domain-containing protein [Nitrosomonas sp.]|nr:toll/interleukin-1 receptor domain-containing protein [Nitrosomonas sp.]
MAKPVKVFVSYSWEQEKHTRIVDELEGLCRQRNIQLIRDKNEMQHGELIKEFMDQLSGGEHIITVFSDAYFKSKWCMFELLEVWRKGDFKDRTYPIQADDCDLVDRNYRLSLVTHWKKLHEEEKAILDGLDPGVILDEFRYVNLYRDIYQNINELMNFSASRMTTELGQLRARDYGQIFDLINPSSQLKTGNSSANQRKASSMDKIKAKKILYLEEQLEIWEDKLNDFKKDYARAEGSEKKFAIKRHIQDEINPEISRINEQYIHLIKDVEVAETEADPIVEELVKVFEGANIQLADAHQQQLDTILREIRDQNKSAAAKLKIALPIIPMLVNYELELDT